MGWNGGYIGYDATPVQGKPHPGVWGIRDVDLATRRGTWQISSYFDLVMSGTPTAYWTLDEISGTTATDSSGNAHHGTYTGGVTLGQPGLASEGRYAAQFDGSNDYVSLPNLGISGNTPITVVIGIKPTASYDGTQAWTLFGFGAGSNGRACVIRTRNLGVQGVTWYWWANDLNAAVNLSDGQPHHIACKWDGTTRKIFVDGVLKALDTPSAPNWTNSGYAIGRSAPTNGEYWSGLADEVVVYSAAKDDAYIEALATAFLK